MVTRAAPRWAGVGVFLVVAVIVYVLFRLGVRPAMVTEARRVEDEVARVHAQARLVDAGPSHAEAGGTAEVTRELSRLEDRVAALSGILANPREAEAVLQSLGELASAAGVRFVRFAPEPASRLDGYLANAVSVTAEGKFFDFLRFFDRVAGSRHLVLVEEVVLEVGVDDLLRGRFVAVTVRAAGAGAGPPNAEEVDLTGTDPEMPAGEEDEG